MENYYILHKNDEGNIVYSTFYSVDDYTKKVKEYRTSGIFHKCVTKDDLLSLFPRFSIAWEAVDNTVKVNMAKARTIHSDSLRTHRNKKIAALDVAYMRALESGDSATMLKIAAQKQALRDIPAHPAIEAAQTPQELIALTLDVLLPKEEETAAPQPEPEPEPEPEQEEPAPTQEEPATT